MRKLTENFNTNYTTIQTNKPNEHTSTILHFIVISITYNRLPSVMGFRHAGPLDWHKKHSVDCTWRESQCHPIRALSNSIHFLEEPKRTNESSLMQGLHTIVHALTPHYFLLQPRNRHFIHVRTIQMHLKDVVTEKIGSCSHTLETTRQDGRGIKNSMKPKEAGT